MKSRSDRQLAGNWLEVDELDECDPIKTNKDISRTTALDGTVLDPNGPAFPCGIVAMSLFNDTIQLFSHADEQ